MALEAGSSPVADGGGAGAAGHHSSNRLVWEKEGIEGSHSAGLIKERLGLELATVDGPTATILAESEQGSARSATKRAEGLQEGGE